MFPNIARLAALYDGWRTSMHTTEQLWHPAAEDIELTDVLHALSDPTRLELVRELDDCKGERRCGSFDLAVAKSTATHHWRVLREAGLVTARKDGTTKYHRLRREDLDARFPGLLDTVLRNSKRS